jgi:hypothetical protein
MTYPEHICPLGAAGVRGPVLKSHPQIIDRKGVPVGTRETEAQDRDDEHRRRLRLHC